MLKRFLKRPVLGQIAWLLLFSFYIAVCLNIAFYKQVLQDLPLNSLRNVLVFISMPVVAFSVVNSVLTLASFIWLNRLLACVFILVGAAAQYFILTYGIIIDRSMIANMMPRFYVSTSKSIIKALINMHSFEIQLSPIG